MGLKLQLTHSSPLLLHSYMQFSTTAPPFKRAASTPISSDTNSFYPSETHRKIDERKKSYGENNNDARKKEEIPTTMVC